MFSAPQQYTRGVDVTFVAHGSIQAELCLRRRVRRALTGQQPRTPQRLEQLCVSPCVLRVAVLPVSVRTGYRSERCSQVFAQRTQKERAVLRDQGQAAPQNLQPNLADIVAIDGDASVFHIDDPAPLSR